MPDDPGSGADRFRKMAADFSDLAKSASFNFGRRYYERLAKHYLLLAEGGSAIAERQGDPAPLQPSVSGDEDHERDGGPVPLAPPQEIARMMSSEEGDKVVERPAWPPKGPQGPGT
jgi:hypothetical protein